MDKSTQTLPVDLAEVLESYQLQRHAEDNMSRPWYNGHAARIIESYANSRDKTVQLAIYQIQTIILTRTCAHNHSDHTAQYLRAITKLKLVNSLVKDDTNRQFLAYACVECVRHREATQDKYPKHGIGDLLSQWLGRKVKQREYKDLSAIVTLLYGPAVASLYLHDVPENALGHYLWGLGLGVTPPATCHARAKPDTSASMLPQDMVG